ncbi:Chromatin-remodelling complex RSC SWI/SNF subunit Rsc7/Swp82 [Penicillium malachiteum]|uniref:Chromatin-remodelling complex RSC SWI/SNF subunit Rsc7/Swp82 n=1 Tax=Penicillium malachiteum TaxID=1324776 RepID=UPI0025498CA2|nr:Chromatin-remodelling complex RSC SWI/SNF subunit Rsc7/Swp82 [Penicillium malachiteum]KAJ5736863.1 Chromatin-remodelling complex RSC SWI/SNF subunit Rsc7/Swp82 [Penicillium malachiteum]
MSLMSVSLYSVKSNILVAMPRKLRAAAQAAAKSMRNAPQIPDISDDEMVDAPPSQPSSPIPDYNDSPENDPDVEPEAISDAEPDADANAATPGDSKTDEAGAATTPAPEDSVLLEAGDGSPSFNGGRQSAIPRKRRIGRPPKNRPPDWDASGPDTPNRVSTPVKRRRGRPAASGGRWARNRGPSHLTQVPVDKEGNMMDVINDEVSLPPNPQGVTKVDDNGHLLEGREYRVRTFTIQNRGDRLYMLSTEPARCIGFRDSYLFFQKHKMLYKIIIDDDAKRDLIERDIIPHSYKGRAIGVVTARSVFREFGAKIVVGGKKILDDYDEDVAHERGDVEGELAVPEDKLPGPGEEYNRNQYVAWHGASSVYHTGAPSVPMVGGKPADPKKRRVPITDENWKIDHARAATSFNSRLSQMRKTNMGGVYEVHTNVMQYPQITQPTHVRYEHVPPPSIDPRENLMGGLSSLNLAPGPSTTEDAGSSSTIPSDTTSPPIFPPVPKSVSDNYMVQDIIFEAPPYSNMDSKKALEEAQAAELEWKQRWSTEAEDGARSEMVKSFAWYP